MRRCLAIAAVIAGCASVLAQTPVLPQTPQPVFRAATDLVTMDVTVTVGGTPVGALRASDFVLTDNGVRQELEIVALETVPATITIIIDIGELMSDTLRSIVGDIDRIVAMVRPGDEVRLMAIDTYVHDLVPLRAKEAFPQIERLSTNGLASAHDAIAAAIMRHHNPDRQHIIIALTNGVDTSSTLDVNALTEIARRSSAPLHIVTTDLFLEDAGPPKSYSTRRSRLQSSTCGPAGLCGQPTQRFWLPFHDRNFNELEAVTGLTGGRWHMPDAFVNRNASIIFSKFYDDHRRSYRLRYVPKGVARDGWHDVKVTIPGHPSYRVSSRPGYVVEPPARHS
jgi:VWFA-related protein